MAKDVQDTVRDMLTRTLNEVVATANGKGDSNGKGLSGMKGVAAGAGAAALVPLAIKGAGKLPGVGSISDHLPSPQDALRRAAGRAGGRISDKVGEKVDEAGGPAGILKNALPFGGDDDDDDAGSRGEGGVPGVGKGRRMPVQQSVDIGVPLETVYNQWTQFEDWPTFMHRVTRVTQDDETTVSFTAKIWGRTKEFKAEIETQRPDQRIKWRVREGITHQGVVTFHELGPNLTRVLLNMDVEPGFPLEKAARGMRHVKRAARADLHRFKAFIEMAEHETGAWRGVIEDGEVVEKHPRRYDRQREYADIDDLVHNDSENDNDDDESDSDSDEGEGRSRGRSSGSGRASSSRGSGGSNSGRSSSRSSGSRGSSGSSGGSSRSASSGRSRGSHATTQATRGRGGGSRSSSGGGGSRGRSSRNGHES